MELLQLKYFCVAAKENNISRAAAKMGVPASGISYSIKRLEAELGVKLFERGANKLWLTDDGKLFLHEVSRALEILETAKLQVTSSENEVKGDVKISVLTNFKVMHTIINGFKSMYPGVNMRINHNPKFRSGDYDIIISDEMYYFEAYEKKVIITEDILLAARKDNPVVQTEEVDMELLKKQKFVMMNENSSMYHQAQKSCFEKGFLPKITMTCDDPTDAISYIENGLVVGLVPAYSWGRQFSDNVILKKIDDNRRNTCIFYRSERRKIKAVDLLCKMIENYDYGV